MRFFKRRHTDLNIPDPTLPNNICNKSIQLGPVTEFLTLTHHQSNINPPKIPKISLFSLNNEDNKLLQQIVENSLGGLVNSKKIKIFELAFINWKPSKRTKKAFKTRHQIGIAIFPTINKWSDTTVLNQCAQIWECLANTVYKIVIIPGVGTDFKHQQHAYDVLDNLLNQMDLLEELDTSIVILCQEIPNLSQELLILNGCLQPEQVYSLMIHWADDWDLFKLVLENEVENEVNKDEMLGNGNYNDELILGGIGNPNLDDVGFI